MLWADVKKKVRRVWLDMLNVINRTRRELYLWVFLPFDCYCYSELFLYLG